MEFVGYPSDNVTSIINDIKQGAQNVLQEYDGSNNNNCAFTEDHEYFFIVSSNGDITIYLNCDKEAAGNAYFDASTQECKPCKLSDNKYVDGDVGNRSCTQCDADNNMFVDGEVGNRSCSECTLTGCKVC